MREEYKKCLNEALAWIQSNYTVHAVFICGSIIRGTANANSDFDIYVIHNGSYRQRVQKFFNGVPCEVFINSIEHTNNSFEVELRNNRPCTAHMLATGVIYFDDKKIDIKALIEKARKYMNLSVGLTEEEATAAKYSIALAFEDATDVLNTDEASAQMLLYKTVFEIITYLYSVNKIPLPRVKERISNLAQIDSNIASLVQCFYTSSDIHNKHELVAQMLNRLHIAGGFFEWISHINEK